MPDDKQPPILDPAQVTPKTGSSYPEAFKAVCIGREKRVLGDPLGLKDFGVNLTTLAPGAGSAQRHWHSAEDEFVYVVSGSLTLITDAGEQELGPGMVAGFPAGVQDGHCLVNRSDAPATFLEVGSRRPEIDEVGYPDVDLRVAPGRVFTNKAGEPY